MQAKYLRLVIVGLFFIPFLAFSNSVDITDCDKIDSIKKTTVYTDLQGKITSMAKEMCQNLKNTESVFYFSPSNTFMMGKHEYQVMSEVSKKIMELFPENVFNGASLFASSWKEVPSGSEVMQQDYGKFKLITNPGRRLPDGTSTTSYEVEGRLGLTRLIYDDANPEQSNYCINAHGRTCDVVMRDLENAVSLYNYFAVEYVSERVQKSIGTSLKEWEAYRKTAPVIGFFSRIITTKYHSEHFYDFKNNPYPGPPPSQIRAIELSFVVEHLPSAEDSDETEIGVALEWLGFNDWDNEVIPWGMGITSVYVDRKDSKSLGHGLMLHLDNSYSIGVVRRGDDNTVFFNIDFAKWFGENKQKLGDFKN